MGLLMFFKPFHSVVSTAVVAFFTAIYGSAVVYADLIRPFSVSNQSPFVDIQSMPFTPDAQILRPQEQQVSLDLAWASHSLKQSGSTEEIVLDGESVQLNLMLKRGIGQGSDQAYELGFLLPLRYQGGGLMDSGIVQFHSTFGLPQGERTKTPKDQIHYRYSAIKNGQVETLVDVSPSGASLGDVRFFLSKQWQTRTQKGYNLAWQNELKLPTGKVVDWSGNEAFAFSTSLAYDTELYYSQSVNWQAFGHIGLRFSEKGKVLSDQQNQLGLFGGLGLVMQWQLLQLQAQLDTHSATYDSTLNALGPSLQITFGGNYLTHLGVFSFSIGEDVFPETAPDVVFKLAWDRSW